MKRKWPTIDLLYLYSKTTSKEWNQFLTRCLKNHDVQKLTATRYGIQAGMVDLAKKKLNSEKMIEFFLRLERSLEQTIKKILREKDPNPCDQPLLAVHNLGAKGAKNARDNNLELYFRKTGY